MKTKFIGFILITAAYFNLNGQINLKTEEVAGRKYSLTFTNSIPFDLAKENNISAIHFYGFLDESRPGEFILPSKDIFINIPVNSKPNVNLQQIKTSSINALPELNPVVERIDDSTKIYSDTKNLVIKKENQLIELRGYLWIGDQYCIHIKVHPYYYDFEKRATIKIEEFKIDLVFGNSLSAIEGGGIIKSDIVSNQKFHFQGSKKRDFGNKTNSDDWIDYSKTYLKIETAKDAIYRISKQDLLLAAVPANSLNPKSFKMYWKGNEIPILVSGEQDNQFDDNDYIEFVGRKNYGDEDYRVAADFNEPYNEYINRYSDTTIYWLTWDGTDGLRTPTSLTVSGTTSDTLDYYDELLHFEQNPWYDFSMGGSSIRREFPFIYENETWNWWGQNVGTKSNGFSVSDLYPGKPAHAYVKLQSWSTNQSVNAHLLHLKINSETTAYDSGYIDKYVVKIIHAAFTSSSLKNGSNSLKIISEPTLSDPNRCFGDWWEIEYPRYLKVNNDSLLFAYRSLASPIFTNVKLTNVQSGNISLYKFFENSKNIKINNFNRNGNVISFADTVRPGQKYIITSDAKIKSPKIYNIKQFVDLRNSSNQADYILLTHPIFLTEAQNYLSFIESNYNVTTKLINVYDIYDEFNFGFFAPEPIKDFLIATSANWQKPAPKNVFIVGRANYDFHGYKTTYLNTPVEPNLVPSFGVPVSDVWYVIWDSTGAAIPQMNIGRLPARTLEEFQHYFTKHQNYTLNNFDEWNKKYLFFTGGNFTNPSQLDRLKAVNDFVADNYVKPPPIGGIATHFYKTANPVTNFGPYSPEEIQQTLSDGGVFISYLGHSGTQTWDNSITDPSQLNNDSGRNPLISDFGCSTAKFAEPDITSFSELFVNGLNGQAIAYVGNSSLGYESTALTYPRFFYGKILRDSVFNTGDAHRLSKIQMLNEISASGTYEVFSYTNTLVGDPIINLPIPPKPNFAIESDGISFVPSIPTDINDSLVIFIKYANLGRVISDSLEIKVEDFYQTALNSVNSFKRVIPLNYDEFSIAIPIKDLPGEHILKISLDVANKIDELYETDNSIELNYNVLTGSIRTTNIYENSNWIGNEITFLNPSANPSINDFEIELSFDKNFETSIVQTVPFDTFYTNHSLSQEYQNKKFWMRAKLPNSNKNSITQGFYSEGSKGFILNDSIGFSNATSERLKITSQGVVLDSNKIVLEIISKGYWAGNSANINLNDENQIPENTLVGQHVCLFDAETFEFLEYKLFDIRGNPPGIVEAYITFLDTLSSNYLVAIAICSDADITNATLKTKIKEFGSVYVDSLGISSFSSWAILGRKGAAPGSVPEAFNFGRNGAAIIDSTITSLNSSGILITEPIGPSSEWNMLNIDIETPGNSSIRIFPIAMREGDVLDTLDYLTFTNSSISLSNISSITYPYIKLAAEFEASTEEETPEFKQITLTHKSLPEIGTNYQTVQITADSIDQGEEIGLSFYVYNIGDVAADSINVLVELIDEELTRQKVYETIIPRINSFERKQLSFNYNTVNSKGAKQFFINLDPENKIKELFEDNNFYTIPFVIKGDSTMPNLQISFDGKEILDGEYISSNPMIRIELGDPSLIPIIDTSSVLIQLNNREIYYSDPANNLNYTFSNTNPKMIVEYQPVLEKGEYFLNIFAKDASGNLVNPSGVTKTFYVEAETKIMDIFNYPNPFADDTYFTFTLTQIPDELKINVYTVAGRLVKELRYSQGDLSFDFNKLYWDGKDEDGDRLANGVYFYKVIMYAGDKVEESIHKMAVLK